MAFPPFPQPKHLKIPLLGETIKEGVLSLWKGHLPEKLLPDLESGTYLSIKSLISTEERISSMSGLFAKILREKDKYLVVYGFLMICKEKGKKTGFQGKIRLKLRFLALFQKSYRKVDIF